MAAPLTVWICDSCGDDITEVGKALVTWRTDDERRGYDFLIVHKNLDGRSCDPEAKSGFVLNTELSSFLGADGLAYALSLLSPGPIMGDTAVRVADFNGFVDLIRRTQTPWYEEARSRFGTEETRDRFGDANEIAPYVPVALERIAQQQIDE